MILEIQTYTSIESGIISIIHKKYGEIPIHISKIDNKYIIDADIDDSINEDILKVFKDKSIVAQVL